MASDPFSQPPSQLHEVVLYLKAAVAGLSAALAILWRWGSTKSKRLDESQEARIEAEQRHQREIAAVSEKLHEQARASRYVTETLLDKLKPPAKD